MTWYRSRLWAAALLIAAVITAPMTAAVLGRLVVFERVPLTWRWSARSRRRRSAPRW